MRLSLGIIIGFTLLAFRDGIIGADASSEAWIRKCAEGIQWWGYITFGLVVVFLPLIFKSQPAEYYVKMFRTLDEVAKRGGFTDDQKQRLYSSFAERILIAFDPTLSIAEQRTVMKERLEELNRDILVSSPLQLPQSGNAPAKDS